MKITDRKTKLDWAVFIREIADDLYPKVPKITLVMDNLATHKRGYCIKPSRRRRQSGYEIGLSSYICQNMAAG